MKKFYILLVLVTISCASVKNTAKQEYIPFSKFKGDTAKYLTQNFVTNKQMYVNKKFDVLLSKLEIPVKFYVSHSITDNFHYSDGITISFYDDTTTREKVIMNKKISLLNVKWETPISTDIIDNLIKNGSNGWKKEQVNLFGKQLVKSIDLVDTGGAKNKH